MRREVIGNATLYLGDCLEIIPTISKVDAVITDPPYFLPATHYSTRTGSARSLGDLSILEFYYKAFFSALPGLLNADGFAYVFCDGQSYPIFYACSYPHFKRVRPLIWDKVTSINGFAWRHQHELILFAEGNESKPVVTGDGDVIRVRSEPIDDREHLAQKPIALMERLVGKTTPENGLVFDPFMGSGTTGIACHNLSRAFVGIEINPEYFDIACKRIEDAQRQARMFG